MNHKNKIQVKLGPSENSSIIMFRSTEPGKFDKEDYRNVDLLNKIIEDVKNDFITKCIKLLETSSTIPSSLYTYEFFDKMFSIEQSGDVTASEEVYSFVISASEDLDDIVNKILKGYIIRNGKWASSLHETPQFVIRELLEFEEGKESLIRRMFGAGEFPFLEIRYAWHEGRKEWHYVYNITR